MIRWLGKNLFGFKYVNFEFGYSSFVRRVLITTEGREYVKVFGDIVLFKDEALKYYHGWNVL